MTIKPGTIVYVLCNKERVGEFEVIKDLYNCIHLKEQLSARVFMPLQCVNDHNNISKEEINGLIKNTFGNQYEIDYIKEKED